MIAGNIEGIDAEIQRAEQSISASLADRVEVAREAQRKQDQECSRAIADARVRLEQIQSEIRELQNMQASSVAKLELDLRTLKAESSAEISSGTAALKERRVEASKNLALLREQMDAHLRAEGTKKKIEEVRATIRKLGDEWDRMSFQIGAVEKLGVKKTKSLPINGVSIGDDGILQIDQPDNKTGETVRVPIGVLNTASRVRLAIEAAAVSVRDSKAKLVFVDGLEVLDGDNYEALKKAALEVPDTQFIWTRVGNGPLSVNVEGM